MEIGTAVWIKEEDSTHSEWKATSVKSKTVDFNGNIHITVHDSNNNKKENLLEWAFCIPKGSLETTEIKFRNDQYHRDDTNKLNELNFLNEPEILEKLKSNYNKQIHSIYFHSSVLLHIHSPTQGPVAYSSVNVQGTIKEAYDEVLEKFTQGIKNQSLVPIQKWSKATAFIDKEIGNDGNSNPEVGSKQAIIITGASGTMKHSTSRAILGYLLKQGASKGGDAINVPTNELMSHRTLHRALSKMKSSTSFKLYGAIQMEVFEKILKAQIVLEAFGSTRTKVDPSANRCVQYVALGFNTSGALVRGNFQTYLLDYELVSKQSVNESNFHIFYQLVRGSSPEELERLGLANNPNLYRYLNQGKINTKMSDYYPMKVSDKQKYELLRECLDFLDIDMKLVDEMFAILAAILHLGNLSFLPNDSNTACLIENCDTVIPLIAQLLGITVDQLMNALLGQKKFSASGNNNNTVTVEQAEEGRDAFSRFLYAKVYNWLLTSINHVVNIKATNVGDISSNTISILDMIGFEILEVNLFDQFLINYSSELLQQIFNETLFAMELIEYDTQEIQYDGAGVNGLVRLPQMIHPSIENSCFCVASIIEGGIFTTLDNISLAANPSLVKFTAALSDGFTSKYSNYFSTSLEDFRQSQFHITHYAGLITYNYEDFIEKNIHDLHPFMSEAVDKSTLTILYHPSTSTIGSSASAINSRESLVQKHAANRASMKSSRLSLMMKPQEVLGEYVTHASAFRTHLGELLTEITASIPYFVRCINVNTSNKSDFDPNFVMKQLHASGIIMAGGITRSQFFTKLSFVAFYNRYRTAINVSKATEVHLPVVLKKDQDRESIATQFKILYELLKKINNTPLLGVIPGKEYIYITKSDFAILEQLRIGKHKEAAVILANRGYVLVKRLNFLRAASAIALLQRAIRGWLGRRIVRLAKNQRAVKEGRKVWFENNVDVVITNLASKAASNKDSTKETKKQTRFHEPDTLKYQQIGIYDAPVFNKNQIKSVISFIPCNKFEGRKEGYQFCMGKDGLGYYPDVSKRRPVLQRKL